MTRKVCFAAMAALALTVLAPEAHALVCERGYVTEMVFAAPDTAGSGSGYPRLLFRTDQTGFTPLPSPLTKVTVNERFYTALGLPSSATAFDQAAFEEKVQTVRAAFLARTPIRVYSFGDRDCTTASKLEIMVCTSETACDL